MDYADLNKRLGKQQFLLLLNMCFTCLLLNKTQFMSNTLDYINFSGN